MTSFLQEGLILNLPALAEFLNCTEPYFKVIQVMGGGMGLCAKIEANNGNFYALKVIYSDNISDQVAQHRYISEARNWLTLSACEGVCEALTLVNVNEIPCIVSRWMEGGDLSKFVGNKDKQFFYKTFDRIISTMQWVHSNCSVIHRDLKPSNILLDSEGNVYVADWGLAKEIASIEEGTALNSLKGDAHKNNSLTQDGLMVGTIAYASPEQIMGLPNVDFRSDIYSIGCMMYEWETGKLPFTGTFEQIARSQIHTKPQKIGGLFSSTNFGVEKMILKCLEKKPEDRYQSYDEFLGEFRKVASKLKEYKPTSIGERFKVVKIGQQEFENNLKNGSFNMIQGDEGVSLINGNDVLPYIKEAKELLVLCEFEKAIAIFNKLYIPELVSKEPNDELNKYIVINLAFAYIKTGKPQRALEILKNIENGNHETSAYYVNISYAYIQLKEYVKVMDICEFALKRFRDDTDLLGNLTIAYIGLGMLDKAQSCALYRIKKDKNVNSLCETASVCYAIAEQNKNTDFPTAIDNYKLALNLYSQAELMNPNYINSKRNIANVLFKLRRYKESSDKVLQINNLRNEVSPIEAFYLARNLLWTQSFIECIQFCDKWLKVFLNDIPLQRIRSEAIADALLNGQDQTQIRPMLQSCMNFYIKIIEDKENRVPRDFVNYSKLIIYQAGNDINNINKGLVNLETAVEIFPQQWNFEFYLAHYLNFYNQSELALEAIEKAISKAPWREICYKVSANIYTKLGKKEKAEQAQNKYIEIKGRKALLYK